MVETESLSSLHNPPVIKEYLSASDEDKLLFEMTFKAFKTNTQLKARERWYDWKMGVMEKIRPDVEEMLDGMREVGTSFPGVSASCMVRATRAPTPDATLALSLSIQNPKPAL